MRGITPDYYDDVRINPVDDMKGTMIGLLVLLIVVGLTVWGLWSLMMWIMASKV